MTQLLEVSSANIAYMCLGGFIVAFSMFSLLAREKVYINEVVVGTAFGIFMGPYFAGIFDPRSWGQHSSRVTLEVMRIVLATGLFAIGVELPKSYMARHAKSLLAMVVPTMAIGWVIVAGLLRAIFPGLNFISCLAVSACLTPTDPIICAAIVGGKYARKHVPINLRQILSAESAANDGLAYPFLTLAIYLTVDKSNSVAIVHWILLGWLYQVFLGVLIGTLSGIAFRYLMRFSHQKGFINRESYVAQYLALAVFITGLVNALGCDDLLAAFAAGTAISWDGDFNIHTEGEIFASVIDLLLNCACFIYIGAWIPFDRFTIPELGISPEKLVLLAVGILFLRRIPAILMLYKFIPEISNWREALFSGHFGPMGVGAVFISTLAIHKLPEAHDPPQTQQDYLSLALEPIVAFIVLTSIIIHGLSIPFFTISKNVSRTVSIQVTASASARNRAPPDWLLSVSKSVGAKSTGTFAEPDIEGSAQQNMDQTVNSQDDIVKTIINATAGSSSIQPTAAAVLEVEEASVKGSDSERSDTIHLRQRSIVSEDIADEDVNGRNGGEQVASPNEGLLTKSVHFPEERGE